MKIKRPKNDVSEAASLLSAKRWINVNQEERSRQMKAIRQAGIKRHKYGSNISSESRAE